MAHEDGQEEAAERSTGTTHLGQDRGTSRKNEDDPEMHGEEKLRGKVAMMDKEYQDQLERREHVPVPKRAAHHARKFDGIGFIAWCPDACRCSGERNDRHTPRNAEKQKEAELKVTAKAEAAEERTKRSTWTVQSRDKRSERDRPRGRTSTEGTRRRDSAEGMPGQRSGGSSSSGTVGPRNFEDAEDWNRMGKRSKATKSIQRTRDRTGSG